MWYQYLAGQFYQLPANQQPGQQGGQSPTVPAAPAGPGPAPGAGGRESGVVYVNNTWWVAGAGGADLDYGTCRPWGLGVPPHRH